MLTLIINSLTATVLQKVLTVRLSKKNLIHQTLNKELC
jgi:hypothetical protein